MIPDELKPWPDDLAVEQRHHNQPPLEDRITLDFDSALHARGLDQRVKEIIDAAERAPDVTSRHACAQAGDLIAMARAVEEQVEGEREVLNRPLLTAQRSLKARADTLLSPMKIRMAGLRIGLEAYVAGLPEHEVIQGDYGARVSRQTLWQFEIVDPAKLPLSIRRHPEVIDAIEKVIRRQVRGGERKIAGVRIFPEVKASVR